MATSVVLGNVTEAGTRQGIKPETTRELLVEAIRHMVAGLERRTPPYAYPVLRALAGLAPPEVAGYAAETAAELAGDAVTARARYQDYLTQLQKGDGTRPELAIARGALSRR